MLLCLLGPSVFAHHAGAPAAASNMAARLCGTLLR